MYNKYSNDVYVYPTDLSSWTVQSPVRVTAHTPSRHPGSDQVDPPARNLPSVIHPPLTPSLLPKLPPEGTTPSSNPLTPSSNPSKTPAVQFCDTYTEIKHLYLSSISLVVKYTFFPMTWQVSDQLKF